MAEAADVTSYICTNDESKDHDHGVDDEKEGKGKVRHIGCQEH